MYLKVTLLLRFCNTDFISQYIVSNPALFLLRGTFLNKEIIFNYICCKRSKSSMVRMFSNRSNVIEQCKKKIWLDLLDRILWWYYQKEKYYHIDIGKCLIVCKLNYLSLLQSYFFFVHIYLHTELLWKKRVENTKPWYVFQYPKRIWICTFPYF